MSLFNAKLLNVSEIYPNGQTFEPTTEVTVKFNIPAEPLRNNYYKMGEAIMDAYNNYDKSNIKRWIETTKVQRAVFLDVDKLSNEQMETNNQLKPNYDMNDVDRARLKIDIFVLASDLAKDRNWTENQFFEFADRLCQRILT
jgi:hypothetical protein